MSLPPLFADECCPAPLVRALRAAGCDVAYVIELDCGLSDLEQAREAYRQNRVVLSADYDFGELAIRHGEPFRGLILLGPGLHLEVTADAPTIADRILDLGDRVVGHLINLQVDGVRRRKL